MIPVTERLKTDILVVGAGPAGSLAARYAAEKGVKVTMIEGRSVIGTPVRCGELMPSVEEITDMFPNLTGADELFDLPSNLAVRNVEGIRLIDPKDRVWEFPFTGYTTDRDRFDQYLADQAVKSGADLIKCCRFYGREGNIAKTSEGEIEFKTIIGADGPGEFYDLGLAQGVSRRAWDSPLTRIPIPLFPPRPRAITIRTSRCSSEVSLPERTHGSCPRQAPPTWVSVSPPSSPTDPSADILTSS